MFGRLKRASPIDPSEELAGAREAIRYWQEQHDARLKQMNACISENEDLHTTVTVQRNIIADREARIIELEDQRRLNALVAASQTREHLLAEEVISRAEEYFDWLLDDWREDSAVKHFFDKENDADMPADGVIAGDNPIP